MRKIQGASLPDGTYGNSVLCFRVSRHMIVNFQRVEPTPSRLAKSSELWSEVPARTGCYIPTGSEPR